MLKTGCVRYSLIRAVRRSRSSERSPSTRRRRAGLGRLTPNDATPHLATSSDRRGLVERDADAAVTDVPEIDPGRRRASPDLPDVGALDAQRVEIRRVGLRRPSDARAASSSLREPWIRSPIARQALGAVIHRVHRGHVGEQRLRRADVRRGFLATDVLLAGLRAPCDRRARRARPPTHR